MSQIAMSQTSRKHDLEERTARFGEPVVKLHHFFIENLLSRFVPLCPALPRFAGSGEARKIGNWKLKIGIIALLFFIWCDYASAFTITTPTKNKVGLVGHWTFDGQDMLTGTVRDVSGNNNHGSMVDMATATARVVGKVGQALQFDGVDDYIETTSMNSNSLFSTSFWFKTSAPSSGSFFIISWPAGFGCRLNGVTAGKVNCYADSGSPGSAVSSQVVNDNKWHYLVYTYTASGQNLYIDGAFSGSATETLTSANGVIRLARDSGGGTSYFPGSIDDVRIYNRALSASEIQALYKMGEGTKTATTPKTPTSATGCTSGLSCGLVGHWTFDGQDMLTGTVRDVSGNNNHGSMVNMATATVRVAGKVGQALSFDGVDDFVNVSNSSSIQGIWDGGGSISYWIMPRGAGEGEAGYWFNKFWVLFANSSHVAGQTGLEFNVPWSDSVSGYAKWRNTSTVPAIDFNKWHHIVLVYNSDSTGNDPSLYIDGVSFTLTEVITPSGTISSDSGSALAIGGNISATRTSYGVMDDVRIYNRVLSVSEIQALYKTGEGTKVSTTPKPPTSSGCTSGLSCGLVGHWTFDGADMLTGTVRDVSGNNNHGSMVGMATATARVSGKLGQGLQFDGVDDRINLDSVVNLKNLVIPYTVSVWMASPSPDGFLYDFAGLSSANKTRVNFASWANRISVSTGPDGAATNSWRNSGILSNFDYQTWNLYTFVFVSTTETRVYVNGVYYAANDSGSWNPGTQMLIGARSDGSYIDAKIDDFRVYNRALSAQEIQQLYNMGR